MSYNNVALAVIPSGIKSSIVYSLIGGNMTFARGSSATRRNKDGLIEYVDTSVPRLDYDGAIPHLLLEPQRSNELQYSEDFSNAYWTKLNVTPESNANIAPDGNTTADIMRETTATGEHRISRAYSFAGGGASYTFSVFAKYNGRKLLNLFSGTSSRFEINATFDLIEGTATSVTGTATIESYPNGWYRCIVTGISSTSGSSTLYYRHRNDAASTSYAGDTNAATLLWGAQLEIGSYATSYIPRLDTVTATRTAETCDSGTGDFNSSEGVLFAEIAPLADDGTFRVLSISDGTSNNRVSLYYSTTSQRISASVFVSSVGNGVINYDATTNYNQFLKIAYKYKKDNFALWVNGVEVGTNPTGNTLSTGVLDIVNFTSGSTGNPFYGKVRQAVVFNSALTDSQLAELTR